MVFQGVLIFQAIIVMACVVLVVITSRNHFINTSKLMLVVAFLCLFYNASYLMELSAETFEGAVVALKLEYVGAAHICTFFLIFGARYCKRPIPPSLQVLLSLWNVFIMVSAWTCGSHTYLYDNLVYIADAIIPHLQKDYGVIYIINIVFIILQLLYCCRCAINGWKNGHSDKYKLSCGIMFFCSLMPIAAFLMQMTNLIAGFDIIPSLTAIGLVAFFVAILLQDTFNISEVAHDNIFSNMKEPIIILDMDYGFVEANAHAEAMFPSLQTCSVGELLPEQTLLAYVRMGTMDKLYLKDHVYEVHVDRIYEEEIPIGFSLLLTDLTDEYNQMKQIHALMTEAKQADRAKTDFLASMSHEIRTPINSIIGMNEMILREAKTSDVKKYAYDVKYAASMLLSLVNDILDSSKIASGKLNIIPAEYSMRELLEGLYNMLEVRARQKNLKLIFDIDPTIPSRYIGDDIRIGQVLINLITNGIKYTEEGSVMLSVSAQTDGDNALIHFSVRDTGYGIRKEHIDQLFARFQRVEEQRFRNIEGTGLGLNVSAGIVELMGSKIQIESEIGVGSEFFFDLPQKITDHTSIGMFDERSASIMTEEEHRVSFIAPKARVLVVDDNDMNLKVFASLLKKTQIQITQCTSGRECIELVRDNHYDIIFLDHMMPEMDGIETLKRMMKITDGPCADSPVIMLTANAITGAREKYLAEGFRDFLPKPIFADQLEEMVCRYLPQEYVEKQADTAPRLSESTARRKVPEIEEIDYDYAMAVWKDEDSFYAALQDFHDMLPRVKHAFETLAEGLDREEVLQEYKMHLHTMKGTSAMVGALLLSKLSRIMELATQNGDVERVRFLHNILMEEITNCRRRLSVVAPKKKQGTTQEILDILEMLQNALEREDYTSADFLVKQLEGMEIAKEQEKSFDLMYEQVLNLDSKAAIGMIEKIKNFF